MNLLSDIDQGLALLPAKMTSPGARIILFAISRQENPQRLEKQIGGPARGDYQFELGGGVHGVLKHPASRPHALTVCAARGVAPTETAVFEAIGHDPVLAAALARLLLWTDPARLPWVGDERGSWALYLRVWRPGKPHPKRWPDNYAEAMKAVGA